MIDPHFFRDFMQKDPKAFRQDLMNIAQTTLSSKLLTHEKNHFGLWFLIQAASPQTVSFDTL